MIHRLIIVIGLKMTESFAQLFEESLAGVQMQPGSIIKGTVVAITSDVVTVHAGLKSEGIIPTEQFTNDSGDVEVQVGDVVDVALDAVEDGFGSTILSREKAKRHETWIRLEHAYNNSETVMGRITGKVKGGFTVDIDMIRAFLPGSLVDVRPVRDTAHLEDRELDFKVIKLDPKRNNVVVSRRSVIEQENSVEREELLAKLDEAQVVKGIVKNLTDYGAFVDLGGIDGLLHITDMSWKRIKHPSEVVQVGDEIDVKVLKFDKERSRVSLGMKQLGDDPWVAISKRYPEGSRLVGEITNLTDYGCFVEIEEGVEGLVHVSEMDWTSKNVHPSKLVNLGDKVEVMVLEIDEERRRISLGLKQCKTNPWDEFAALHKKGDKVTGKIKSITDFGIFIGLDGGIDGLVHMSDISWSEPGEDAVREYKKGQEIEAVVLSVDAERERISLGVKQTTYDPYNEYCENNQKGTVVTGTVTKVDEDGLTLELATEVEGFVRKSELSRDPVNHPGDVAKEGDQVEAKIINHNRKQRQLLLSIKSKDQVDEEAAVAQYQKQSEQTEGPATLGDLIKEQMDRDKSE